MEIESPQGRSDAESVVPAGQGRLAPDDWIRAGVEALLDEGPAGIRVARLARRLGVTPGSFYWHFENRDELRDQLLRYWSSRLLRPAAEAAKVSGSGASQIRALPGILMSRSLPMLDAAIRRWAIDDPVVAKAVARADLLRLRVVAAMFREAGLDPDVAEQRAKLLAWAFRGSRGVDPDERGRAMQDLVEALIHDAR